MRPHASKTLVLDADQGSALAAARSLHRAGYQVFLAGASAAPTNARSNAVFKYLRYPDPMLDQTAFCAWVADAVAVQDLALVLPMTERSLVPLANHANLPAAAHLAVPDLATLLQVTDKATTFDIAKRVGVAIPASEAVTTMECLERLRSSVHYPVVLKPTQSVSDGGQSDSRSAFSVAYALTDDELLQQSAVMLAGTPFVLQEHFTGQGVGVEVLAHEGEILYAFQHRRLHEVPLTGGGSSLRVSEDVAPVLHDAATRLLREMRWTGVAMVEFKWRPESNEYRLMEINGRFWGSLPLAVAAGADFPAMLAALLLEGKRSGFPDYRRGVYCRHLARDVQWHELVMRSTSSPLAQIPRGGDVLRDLLLTLSPRHYFDIQRISDPIPGVLDIGKIVSSYARRLGAVVAEKWFTFRQRLLWHNGTVATCMRDAGSVLFLCYGNINRSAAAELLLRAAPGTEKLHIHSAGFHQQDGRPVDPRMAALLGDAGVKSTTMRSTTVNDALIQQSDVVFVMEKDHFDRVVALSPAAATRTFLLGGQLPDNKAPGAAIADPYNRTEAVYRHCLASLQAAVDQLANTLRT